MRCTRLLRCAATLAAASLIAEAAALAQPYGTNRDLRTAGERESRDPFDGIVSPGLYDHMGRLPARTQSTAAVATADRRADLSSAAEAWLRLKNRHTTGYRGDPFAQPEPPAGKRLREPTSSASRRPGAGDAGWFGGTARAFGDRGIQAGGMAAGPFGRGAGQIAPTQPLGGVPLGAGIRTIPDPTLQQPLGQGAFRYGGGPGSSGPFGFDNDVITGSGAEETRVPP